MFVSKLERRNSKRRSGYTFGLILQKLWPLSQTKVKSGTDLINPSIESSDFLFWHEKILTWISENFVENRQTKFSYFEIYGVCKHTLNLNS